MATYRFRGYTITNCGYHQPDHCVWWEAVDDKGNANFHGNTLREVEFMILDDEWEQKMQSLMRKKCKCPACGGVHTVEEMLYAGGNNK